MKRMAVLAPLAVLLVLPALAHAQPLVPGPLETALGPGSEKEPNCDQLRAMWRFSKRQSRAAQITNEIPTYRDPFAYPMWDAFPTGRSDQGQSGMSPYGSIRFRNGARPVYGQMVQHRPRFRNVPAGRVRMYDEGVRIYDGSGDRRRPTARVSGGGLPPQQSGSFQHLKDIMRAERLRELQEQRMAEEAAARSLKDISKPHFGRIINAPSAQASPLDLVLGANTNNNKRDAPARALEAPEQEGPESDGQPQDQVADENMDPISAW